MKKLILSLLVSITFFASAQNDQKEINEQVWIPFTKAIINQDVKAFIEVHSKDLIRVERNAKKVFNYSDYEKGMTGSWPRWKESIQKKQARYTFELRFTERLSNGTQAFEVGYFKNETVLPTGEKEIYYGKFHVALRKENNAWKVLVDSNEEGNISEKDFLAAQSLE